MLECGLRKTRSKSRKTIQIFVNVDGSKEFPMDVALSDTVSDVVKKILKKARVATHVTYT